MRRQAKLRFACQASPVDPIEQKNPDGFSAPFPSDVVS